MFNLILLCVTTIMLSLYVHAHQTRQGLDKKLNPLFTLSGYMYLAATTTAILAFVVSITSTKSELLLMVSAAGYLYLAIHSFSMSRKFTDTPYVHNPYSREIIPDPPPKGLFQRITLVGSNIFMIIVIINIANTPAMQ